MVSNLYQMPSGIPGSITRPEFAIIEAWMLNQTTPPTSFGVPVKNVSGTLQPIGSGDVASSIIGVLVRPYPTSGNGTDGLGVAVPNKAFPADLLKKGYINVVVNNFAAAPPVKQGPVYVRVANGSTGKVVGNFEAAAETTFAHSAFTGTGTQTIGTISASGSTPAQVYTVTLTSTGATASFVVTDANGENVGGGNIGTQATLDNGLSFLVTTGGTPTTGDHATITVTQNNILIAGNTYFTGGVDAFGNGEIAYAI